MTQAKSQRRQVDGLRESRDRVGALWLQLPPNKQNHQHRNERDGNDGGRANRQRLSPGQGTEHPPLLRLQQKDREERDDDNQQREEERGPDLLGSVDQNLAAFGL